MNLAKPSITLSNKDMGRSSLSAAERDRRWAAVRAAMEAHGIDVLVAQANNDYVGGMVQWLSGTPAAEAFAVTVALGRTGGITALNSIGAISDVEYPIDNPRMPGVTRMLTSPVFQSVLCTNAHLARMIGEALSDYSEGTIGLLGLQQLSSVTVDAVREAFPRARIIDASDIIDPIRAVKSAEEIAGVQAAASIQDRAMEKIFNFIRPGQTEREVFNYAQQVCYELGANQGLFNVASGAEGEPAMPRRIRDLHRTLGKGDTVHVLLETDSPSGLYAHIVRTAVLGKAPADMVEEQAFVLEAQAYLASLLRPGVIPQQVCEDFNVFMVKNDRPPEMRLNCHGQGYDMVERPIMRPEETLAVAEDMVIACHPMYVRNSRSLWTCGNYHVRAEVTVPMHRFCGQIVEL